MESWVVCWVPVPANQGEDNLDKVLVAQSNGNVSTNDHPVWILKGNWIHLRGRDFFLAWVEDRLLDLHQEVMHLQASKHPSLIVCVFK